MILLFFTTATESPITGISCMMALIPASAFSDWAFARDDMSNKACNMSQNGERIFFMLEFKACKPDQQID